MKRKIMQIAALILALVLLIPGAATAEPAYAGQVVRVGLFYADEALVSANLDNADGYGLGYRFGYFNSDRTFTQVGYTAQEQITMLKGVNLYLDASGNYSETPNLGDLGTVGCYHLQVGDAYPDFDTAYAAASQLSQGFVAWIEGAYYVRWGSFTTNEEAQIAIPMLQQEPGAAGLNVVVSWTSKYGVTVTQMRTTKILFQFDGNNACSLGVMPDITGAANVMTWFRNNRFHGGFQYQRIAGGNMTVSNFVELEDYVKGVIPYEMSGSWPLEALKAQAVAARTYVIKNLNNHKSYGFDVCNNSNCQVYFGEGDGSARYATATSNQAVDETRGMFLWYQGELTHTNFSSSNGGASESAVNVWGRDYPYLIGVIDPYEATVERIPGYNWTVTYTASELTALLQEKNYGNSNIVNLEVKTRTDTGNVLEIMFTDSRGKTYTFAREKVRTLLKLKSPRYQINGGDSVKQDYSINGTTPITSLTGMYAISGNGAISSVTADAPQVITGTGVVSALSLSPTPVDVFVIEGTGYGHNVGMSQWGAYAMANLGYTYQDILSFYYTGTYISTTPTEGT